MQDTHSCVVAVAHLLIEISYKNAFSNDIQWMFCAWKRDWIDGITSQREKEKDKKKLQVKPFGTQTNG